MPTCRWRCQYWPSTAGLVSGDPVRGWPGLRFGAGFRPGAFHGLAGPVGAWGFAAPVWGNEPAPVGLACPGGCQTLYLCAGDSNSEFAALVGAAVCCPLPLRLWILGYDTGDFPGEIGVCGDSTTGDKSA